MSQGIAEVNDISIWWEDFGDSSNPSILLIMGANANCMHWPPEFIEPLVDAGFHVIRYDNRDGGKTTWLNKEPLFSKVLKFLPSSIQIKFVDYIFGQGPNEDGVFTQNPDDASKAKYNLSDMAKDGIALMDHLKIDQAHILGASMGGMISQVIALDYPERTLSLTPIMSSPGMGDTNLSGMTPSMVQAIKDSYMLNLQGRDEDAIVCIYRVLSGSRFPFNEDKFREQLKLVIEHGDNPYTGHAEAVNASPSRLERLHEIKVPTLVIHGSEDAILPFDHGEAIAKGIPNSELMTLEGVGHELPVELNDEIISRLVEHFSKA